MKLVKYSAAAALLLSLGAGALSLDAKAADGGTYQSKGSLTLTTDDTTTPPVDPLNPDPETPIDPDPENPVNPGTEGPLSIDIATNFQFEDGKIATTDKTYYAKAATFMQNGEKVERPNYVQVTDKRGGQKGWTLNLKQDGQFKTVASEGVTAGNELTGAEISINKITAVGTTGTEAGTPEVASTATEKVKLSPSDATGTTIMAATAGQGGGTWLARFGDTVEEATKTIELNVPGNSVQEAATYETNLTWVLSDTPGNI